MNRGNALRLLGLAVILLACIVPFVTSPVEAKKEQPDNPPTISEVKANRNLITSGDICIYGEYALPYETLPDVPAEDCFIFRLMNTDNSTEIGAITPYTYFDYGYNLGIFSFYFEDSASAGIVWDTNYTIRVSQNPGQFDSPTYWDFLMPSNAYTSEVTQADNQENMAIRIIDMARDMGDEYTTTDFLEQSALGTILSVPEGATYFRGAIPGLQAMAPTLFLIQSIEVDWDASDNWTTTQADNYTARFTGTWVGNSENATAVQFGITGPTLTGVVIILPACIGAIMLAYKRYRRNEPGLIAAVLIIVLGFVMGWLPAAIMALIFQLLGVYIAFLLNYSRA